MDRYFRDYELLKWNLVESKEGQSYFRIWLSYLWRKSWIQINPKLCINMKLCVRKENRHRDGIGQKRKKRA